MSLEAAVRLVRRYCCDPSTAEYGPFGTVDDTPLETVAETLLAGTHYGFRLVDEEFRSINVQVSLGLDDLGGLLWEQDIRALLRLAAVGHAALPVLLAGGYQSAVDVSDTGIAGGAAFVVTRGAQARAGAETVAYFRNAPLEALRSFRLLVDALGTLHDLGISHRNLWPGSIDVDAGRLRLARFELSALTKDLLQATLDSGAGADRLRMLLRSQPAESLLYLPPERAHQILDDGSATDLVDHDRTDVFALGMVAAEWFLGPYEEDGRRIAELDGPQAVAALAAFQRRVRDRLADSEEIPADLAGTLRSMLESSPDDRPAPDRIMNDLILSQDRIMATWFPPPDRSFVLMYMPDHYGETLERWRWVKHPLSSREGRADLAEVIRADIRGARILYSPHGADRLVPGGDTESKREAKYVILGEKAAWFCARYRLKDAYQRQGTPMETAIVIKYVAKREYGHVERVLKEMVLDDPGRPMPDVVLLSTQSAHEHIESVLRERPSWLPHLPEPSPTAVESDGSEVFKEAVDWLLEYRSTEIEARMYPYVLEASSGSESVARWDRTQDDDRAVKSALFVKYAASRKLRPGFGDFFGSLENDDGGSDVEIFGRRADGAPDRSRDRVEATVVRRDGPDRIVLSRKAIQDAIPQTGWMCPVDDVGSRVSLARERSARWELFANRPLLDQFRAPHTIRTLPQRWERAGAHLDGGGRSAVREILVCEPFSAIQGPPGTGKTTVAAAAIAAYLDRRPGARVLVSAQSNYALDNLAQRILTEIGALDAHGRPAERENGPIPIRVVSRRTTPAEPIVPWVRGNLAVRELHRLARRCKAALTDPGTDPAARPILGEWQGRLGTGGDSIGPELADRLRRGANLVFATCSTSTPDLVSTSAAASAAFDWVVVEEAAKAWTTELAIPLVRGFRWTLIGDHFQLPAHRRDDVERFLRSCANDPHPELARLAERQEEYLRAFDLFGSLFRRGVEESAPLQRLTGQYRMREAIGNTVSRVFYPLDPQPAVPPTDGLPAGSLETLARHGPARLEAPAALAGRDLVWVNTSGLADCYDEPFWSNAGEADVISALLAQFTPLPRDADSEDGLAVLTPYRQQLRLLRQDGLAEPFAHTVHAFQGKEADTVVVSLVRDSRDGMPGTSGTLSRLGHLSRPELVNVLLSRARRLLIVVGNIDQFQSATETVFWPRVCTAFRLYGDVIEAEDALTLPIHRLRTDRRPR